MQLTFYAQYFHSQHVLFLFLTMGTDENDGHQNVLCLIWVMDAVEEHIYVDEATKVQY